MDAVVNHMCGAGAGSGSGGTCGSYFNAQTEDFPAVPFSGWDFNDGKCKTGSGEIENYNDPYQVQMHIDCLKKSVVALSVCTLCPFFIAFSCGRYIKFFSIILNV